MSYSVGQVVKLSPTGVQQFHKEPFDVHSKFAVPVDLSLGGIPGILAVVNRLLASGVSALEVAEKVATWVAPSDVPALQSLIGILQEAESLLSKV